MDCRMDFLQQLSSVSNYGLYEEVFKYILVHNIEYIIGNEIEGVFFDVEDLPISHVVKLIEIINQ